MPDASRATTRSKLASLALGRSVGSNNRTRIRSRRGIGSSYDYPTLTRLARFAQYTGNIVRSSWFMRSRTVGGFRAETGPIICGLGQVGCAPGRIPPTAAEFSRCIRRRAPGVR